MGLKLEFDTKKIEGMVENLKNAGVNVRKTISDELKAASDRYTMDTHLAMSDQYLPAHGKYRTGKTAESIIDNPAVQWEGDVASVPVGFDFSKHTAAIFLIYGTPKMKPDAQLNKIYSDSYAKEIIKKINDHLEALYAEAFVG